MIINISREHRTPKITELIKILREVDTYSEASRISKETIITTLGFGKIGEKYPVTIQNTISWCDLVSRYLDARARGPNNKYTKTLGRLVLNSTFDFISRSFTRKNSQYLFNLLSKEWNL